MEHSRKASAGLMVAYSLIPVLAFTSLFPVASRAAQALPDAAALVPPETVLLVNVADFAQLRTQFEKTSFYKLYKDTAMAPFMEDLEQKIRDKVRQADEEVVQILLDTDAMPQGRLALALVLDEKMQDVDEPPLILIAQWGSDLPKIRQTVDKLLQKAAEKEGFRLGREDYRGATLTTLTEESKPVLSFTFLGDCLIGSLYPDLVKFVVAQAGGAGARTLADDGDYTSVVKATGPHHDIDLYVGIKQIIKKILAEDDSGRTKTTLTNLGLDNVAAFGLSIALARGPADSTSAKAVLKVNGAKNGICKILDLESTDIRPPKFLPAGAYSAAFINLNVKKAFDEVAAIVQKFSPQVAAIMYMPIIPPSPQGEPGVTIKADIVDPIGSQIVIAQTINKNASEENPTESLVAIAVDNRTTLEKSLARIHAMMAAGNPDAKRELLGRTIYLVDLSALLPAFMPMPTQPGRSAVGATVPRMPMFAFSFTETHLIVGLEPAVERAVRTASSNDGDASLASTSWFKRAKAAIPSVVGIATMQDNAVATEFLWNTLRQNAGDKGGSEEQSLSISLNSNPAMMLSQAGLDFIDFSLLPEFDKVRKYFGLSATYGISRPDGFFFEFKYIDRD